jgi:sn-glycerol 3-phosphate transport system ATP-binding protein
MNTLQIRGLEKRFGKSRAVDGISLEVASGEFFVLLGPSGCGKSTLLRLIAGLESPSTGEILINERPVTDLEPRERNVAMVFQNYALYPHMTVYKNLAFPLRARRANRGGIDQRVREVAQMLRIEELLERYPRELSGGQRQRVAIGRALVRRPTLFLFDEPLSNLDAQLRSAMRVELARLYRELGITIIYVTHDQVEAMTLGTRIALMNAGKFEQIGPPRELYETPGTRFVAWFIGSPAMNLLEGRVREGIFESGGLLLKIAAPEGSLTLGVRPEDLEITPAGPWNGRVDLVENLGSEMLVHVRCENTMLVVRTASPGRVSIGEEVSIRPRGIHLFDPTGRRVPDSSNEHPGRS